MIDQNEIKSAFNHFVMGWHFITQKGLRRFVIMPILLNVVLLTGLFWLFVSQISTMIDWVMSFIPDWLSFLSVILLVLSIGSILLFFYFAFTTLSGFISPAHSLPHCSGTGRCPSPVAHRHGWRRHSIDPSTNGYTNNTFDEGTVGLDMTLSLFSLSPNNSYPDTITRSPGFNPSVTS